MGDIGEGELGEVRVGDGLLNIVAEESFVGFLVGKTIAGVGRAWNAVSVLDRSSS